MEIYFSRVLTKYLIHICYIKGNVKDNIQDEENES